MTMSQNLTTFRVGDQKIKIQQVQKLVYSPLIDFFSLKHFQNHRTGQFFGEKLVISRNLTNFRVEDKKIRIKLTQTLGNSP